MVLGLKKKGIGYGVWGACLASLLLGCVEYDRDNPLDPGSPLYAWQTEPSSGSREPSSVSQEPIYYSSSVLDYVPSSSSVEAGYSSPAPSSGSQVPSYTYCIKDGSCLEGPYTFSDCVAINGSPSNNCTAVPSSSSVAAPPSSSSVAPGSSSPAPPSSSSSVPLPSSSSPAPSSSSSIPPSSSSIVPSCADFVEGTEREHYGKMKKQFCDERDGKKYVYVVIGTQTWMAENLNYEAEGSRCYSNLDSNCDKYGRLYNWATVMNNAPSSTAVPSGVRGVCPEGWHLPSDDEWRTMTDYVGNNAGRKLKTTSGWINFPTGSESGNGTDNYGFSALPSGRGDTDVSFHYVGNVGNWWSASEGNRYNAYFLHMEYDNEGFILSFSSKSNLFSVRCVRD